MKIVENFRKFLSIYQTIKIDQIKKIYTFRRRNRKLTSAEAAMCGFSVEGRAQLREVEGDRNCNFVLRLGLGFRINQSERRWATCAKYWHYTTTSTLVVKPV